MGFQDSELDRLAAERDRAFRTVDEKRSALNSAGDARKRLQDAYGSRLEFYKTHIPALKENIDYAVSQSKSCYADHDGAGAK